MYINIGVEPLPRYLELNWFWYKPFALKFINRSSQ
jgi:hypothetical protein